MRRIKLFLVCLLLSITFELAGSLSAQESDLEFGLDLNSPTRPLPQIFFPAVDLSGRGWHRQKSWPQSVAAPEALEAWKKAAGFSGLYRIQFNLWEINQLAKDGGGQGELLANYENLLQEVSSAGGTMILDIFGTPAGLGRVLDKKSYPWDLAAFKELAKGYIREFSCQKKYNVWYEVWSSPDLDDFFLGKKQEYLNLYRAVAEAVQELEAETGMHIPVGGPSSSWWFQNLDGNTIITPEKSLIYELIRFCSRYQLPLDFISWHAYSTDPQADREATVYRKSGAELIREWLAYFRFSRETFLVIDEWNYDNGANLLAERQADSRVFASYIPARIRNMQKAGIDRQVFFSLEDFQNNKEGVVRNVGIFWFDPESSGYKGGAKSALGVLRMLRALGKNLFSAGLRQEDDFCGVIPTIDDKGRVAILVYNYIDQQAALNYLSRNLSRLDPAERNTLLGIIKSDIFAKLLSGQAALESLNLSADLKKMLEAAMGLNRAAEKYRAAERNLKINLSNLQGNYLYQRYAVDAGCNSDCAFEPAEEKHISAAGDYQDTLLLKPYSVNLVIFSKEELPVAEAPAAAPAPAATPAENPAPEKKEPADKPAAPADKPEVPVAQAP